MTTHNLLASLLLAAGVSVGAGFQTAQAGVNTPDRETVAAQGQVVPAFSIDEHGMLHGQDVPDQSQEPFNWNCIC